MFSGVFNDAETFWSVTTGGVFMGTRLLTVMETFPALLVDVPSLAVNVKLSDPV